VHKIILSMTAAGLLPAAVGCGAKEAPPPAVTIGTAPVATAKITVPAPAPENGIADTDRWPDPCVLVTDTELRAVLPQAASITRSVRSGKFDLRDSRYLPTGRELVVPRQKCEVAFDLPHTKDYNAGTGRLTVAMDMVGTRKVAWLNYKRPQKGAQVDECMTWTVSELQCRKGGVVFSVSGHPGFGVRFTGQQGDGREAAERVYNTRVLPMVRDLILAKLP
jgi:hypothetical protein